MAELHAVAEITRKSDHYRQVLLDICGYHQKVFPIFTDSNVVIKMLERGNLSNQTKHLRISYHEVKENVARAPHPLRARYGNALRSSRTMGVVRPRGAGWSCESSVQGRDVMLW